MPIHHWFTRETKPAISPFTSLHGGADRLVRLFLDRLGQLANLVSILLVCRRHMWRQKMTECVDRQMHFRAFFPLGAVVSGAIAALGGRLQRTAVEDRRRRIEIAAAEHPQ